jgi:hypothetical protein
VNPLTFSFESTVMSHACPAVQGALVTGLHEIALVPAVTQLPAEGGLAGTWHERALAASTASALDAEPGSQPAPEATPAASASVTVKPFLPTARPYVDPVLAVTTGAEKMTAPPGRDKLDG